MAAIRETFEETNVDVKDFLIIHNLESVTYKTGKKRIHGFVLFEKQNNFDFDTFELKCNSNVSVEKGGFPEMDDFKWITIEDAKNQLHESQVACLDEIIALKNKLGY
jgi:8-oxo-dGTP pyrophosphatase MutT (NUDIX family)